MNKTPTISITDFELDDLIKALELDREGIAKLCGVKRDAPGWWRFKERIPTSHLRTLAREMKRKLGSKVSLNPAQGRALEFLNRSQSETGISIKRSKQSRKMEGKAATTDLSKLSRQMLIDEIERRGGEVSFKKAKTKQVR